ncbi:MAG: formate dehydrogenase accessory sulfurtransferase FdhD [Planctomycetota bacterium]|jgi:FdhD protein
MSRQDSGNVIREVSARRLSTADAAERAVQETVSVVLEAPVTIDVERIESYTLLCTPDDNLALATGFLLSEGIVDSLDDITSLEACKDDPDIVRVRLKQRVPRIDDAGRNLLIVSSCGMCGSEGLDERLQALPEVGDSLRVDGKILREVGNSVRQKQPLFEACGGTHAAAIFTASGDLVTSAEDTGRHNALDKAIGRCLQAGLSPAGCGAVLSGRVSLEMVGKCARAGMELISAISAPTSLAIEVAQRCGITLCAFVRETRATAFTHPHRVQ